MSTDSWQEPGDLNPDGTPNLSDPRWQTASSPTLPVVGCPDLDFAPVFSVPTAEPEAASAESPSGLSADLRLPSEENVNGLAGADLKEATIALPAGMAISPAAAGGREACTPEEIGLSDADAPSCPKASILGNAKIVTPLLEDSLEGSIYLAQPYENDAAFGSPEHAGGSLLVLYLVAESDGMLIKLAGKVEADSNTGRLTVTFGNLPQLPISELKLSLFGGPRALLVTPPACGSYVVQSSLTPWSGTPAVAQSSNLEIDSGPGGGACPSGRFSPAFTAGTLNNQAGAFSLFSLTFSRQDGEQHFGAYAVQLPPGLLADLKNVALCPEPQASQGDCPQASAIGTTTVGAGPGEDPFYLPEPGQPANAVYLTGPTLPEGPNHLGAPFGLSIVVPAMAGPFDLGDIVLRARIEVDPHTAQLTITSDPLPSIREGIPLDIRTLNITIDRAGLIVNPTSCAPLTVAGTISSISGASAAVSSPFEAANCASLPFEPKLTALTHARTSKADGAYLHVKVVSGAGQANIAKLKLDLPKQLPARQATLRQACASAVFEADPATCPAVSVVGRASVVTPVFGNPLTGPAYLVSHGGAAFPDLEIVLTGEGIELVLDGQTTSSGKGVTSEHLQIAPRCADLDVRPRAATNGPHSAPWREPAGKGEGRSCARQTLRHADRDHRPERRRRQTDAPGSLVSGCPNTSDRSASGFVAKRRYVLAVGVVLICLTVLAVFLRGPSRGRGLRCICRLSGDNPRDGSVHLRADRKRRTEDRAKDDPDHQHDHAAGRHPRGRSDREAGVHRGGRR